MNKTTIALVILGVLVGVGLLVWLTTSTASAQDSSGAGVTFPRWLTGPTGDRQAVLTTEDSAILDGIRGEMED